MRSHPSIVGMWALQGRAFDVDRNRHCVIWTYKTDGTILAPSVFKLMGVQKHVAIQYQRGKIPLPPISFYIVSSVSGVISPYSRVSFKGTFFQEG